MPVARRRFLQLTGAAAAASVSSGLARAQPYPSRPVRLLVGFPAGNGPDIIARLLGQWLSDRLGQQFVIENRPGAASNIAAEAVVNAPPDGYTLLMLVLSNAINVTLYPTLKFSLVQDIAPVASIADAPYLMIVNPALPAKTIPEFIAHAKAHPGAINMASGGTGTSSHIFGETFKLLAGVNLQHVPYRGSFVPDLISGQVHVVFAPMPQAIEYYRNGQLRALGVSTARRLDYIPDVPAIGEFVAGYEAVGWYGLGAPRNTPPEIVQQLNDAINVSLADPKLKERLVGLGIQPVAMTPPAFGTFVADDVNKWAKVIKSAGIKPE